jgi:hypothetical protein
MHKTSFNIETRFLTSLPEERVKAFALWLQLKGLYKRTLIYNYSPQKIHSLTGISPYLAKKYVSIMIDQGWASLTGTTLILHSFKKFTNQSKHITELQNQSYKDIANEIRLLKLKEDYNRQKFMINLRSYRIKHKRISQLKNLHEKYIKNRMGTDYIINSYRRIATILGVSVSHAHRLIKYWSDQNILSVRTVAEHTNRKWYQGFTPHMTSEGLITVNSNGYLSIVRGSELVIG